MRSIPGRIWVLLPAALLTTIAGPVGLAGAAGWGGRAIGAGCEVLFINRLGRQEVEGRGLLEKIVAVALAEIPLVAAASSELLPECLRILEQGVGPLKADADAI
ncbi:DUF2478 domain-containing protein [Microvirga makkahensis]|uniref:DUF2478 domain-containing protein n=1 Tax=Microvirga makkahensis TaxID=1128670 RepID=A0A7X3MX76_9HYPH|nr:DUF2478 domain-containing protein [Microvirga makkahensis]MXQ14670.1 DUF2478 domain-containing protein [Microvirga makkahensis]